MPVACGVLDSHAPITPHTHRILMAAAGASTVLGYIGWKVFVQDSE